MLPSSSIEMGHPNHLRIKDKVVKQFVNIKIFKMTTQTDQSSKINV